MPGRRVFSKRCTGRGGLSCTGACLCACTTVKGYNEPAGLRSRADITNPCLAASAPPSPQALGSDSPGGDALPFRASAGCGEVTGGLAAAAAAAAGGPAAPVRASDDGQRDAAPGRAAPCGAQGRPGGDAGIAGCGGRPCAARARCCPASGRVSTTATAVPVAPARQRPASAVPGSQAAAGRF